ncbi:phosphoenolpyruvate--protein phosphotransferase [Glacieibacterium sp.]|uniref:phosphoenolpyruvate--protein phosphotransferase n=1 Tax=Glacieibacterium sp. TaxID=2860237 RepID=UPI003B005533
MTTLVLGAPLSGWASSLDEVPDPVFGERMMGDGIAIEPIEGLVRAPAAATVIAVAPTLHSVTLRLEGGIELLIHVGLETVGLGGDGFTALVAAGERVDAGAPLLAFDLDSVARRAVSLVTPIIVTSEGATVRLLVRDRLIGFGEPLLEISVAGQIVTDTARADDETTRSIVVPLAHGLHARPAARLVAASRMHDATLTFEAHGRTAAGRSMVAIMALGVRHLDELTIRASGTSAAAAVEAIATLILGGMAEAEHSEPVVQAAVLVVAPQGTILGGVRAAPGLAIGSAVHFAAASIEVPADGAGPVQERTALELALATLTARLATASGVGAEIAEAHRAMLDDPALVDAAQSHVAQGRSAGRAWQLATAAVAETLQATGDARLIERIADLRDLEQQLLSELYPASATGALPALPENAVILADDLLPSQFMALDLRRVAGIVTVNGGPTSHTAILAAAAGVPMLVAVGAAVLDVPDGRTVILDADAARLDFDPDPAALASAVDRHARSRRRHAVDVETAQADCRMADGTRIEVFANLSSVEDARLAVTNGGEGCGLLRTEFLFLDRAEAPGEDEQCRAYGAIAAALGDRPLIVRTLDIGGDKPVAYLPFPHEDNPALGARGVRFSLARPDLLDVQLRAILRGVPGDQCRIMVPMVVEPAELLAVGAALDRAMLAVGRQDRPQLGVMIETPAAALLAPAIAAVADFLSVGSNDLTQYALACDRGNPATAGRIDALHPAVLRLIALAAEGATSHARWLGVCGGVASDPAAAAILIGLGVTELSVTPSAVPAIKAAVRRLHLTDCRDLAVRALACASAAEVRALVPAVIEEAA